MTSIDLPGVQGSAIADWGQKPISAMIKLIRAKARHDKEIADAVLAAPDRAFRVETHRGIHVRRGLVVLQQGFD
jgi:hypothetical protein